MRTLKLLLIAATLGLVSIACVKESAVNVLGDSERIPIDIYSSIQQIQTKVSAAGFVDKDALGLYAVNYTDDNTVPGTLQTSGNQADNVKYVFDEANQKWVPVKSVYYKDINTHVDLYLYYPHQGSVSDVDANNFEVQKDQSAAATSTSLSGYEASDWLWGKGTDITPSEAKVRVQMTHRLSAVAVTLVKGTGFEDGEFEGLDKSVILTGTTRKATLSFASGEATPVGSAQLDGIVMCPQNDGSWRAVVVPQTVAGNTPLFAITIGGISYSYSQDAAVNYQTGKQTNATLTINKKTPSGEYEISLSDTQITDWTEDLNTHGGEARQYYVVNLTKAGTLQTAIEADKKNPAKIRNLKITGPVNEYDFAFMNYRMAILEAVNMKESKIEAVEGSESSKDDVIPDCAFYDKKSLVFFVFPEVVTEIGGSAFSNTTLSGPLILPDDVRVIGRSAFMQTNISSIQFPQNLVEIQDNAFEWCRSATGDLLIPDKVETIGEQAFFECGGFNGRLILSSNLKTIGHTAFAECGKFQGDLSIPDGIKTIESHTFRNSWFSGTLNLNNVQTIEEMAFSGGRYSGELVIPEGVVEISRMAFIGNYFTSICFPSTLRVIGENAFKESWKLSSPIIFPEGLQSIQQSAFMKCDLLPSITLPSTIQTLGSYAFSECYAISSIICDAIEPPSVGEDTFSGVAKDNFTVGVPAQSVKRYQAESGWCDFKRISAHYDFSLDRPYVRLLNSARSETYVLRSPSNYTWSVDADNLPDWITVNPMSGTGKTEVTISVSEMPRTDATFTVNSGSFNWPIYEDYKGRKGEVVFMLKEKDCSFSFEVEQYDSDYSDGDVQTLQTATQGPGIDIVFTGDGYDSRDIAKGLFTANAEAGYAHFFDVEPYKTYKNYFNVYAVTAQSEDSGIGTVNTVKDSKFGTRFTQNRINCEQPDDVFAWAKKADASMDLNKSLVILLMNTSTYEGICYMYSDGAALACCPISADEYPYDFRGIIQHEAGGHGFGKLADEYVYHNAFILNCTCTCCEHPQSDDDTRTPYGRFKSLGWYKNLSMSSDPKRVPWSHMIYNAQYSDYVDIFEGGLMHSRGIYRSESTSCMNNNIPYFSAISRQAIVERIKAYAGEEFSLDDFYANDDDSFGTITKAGPLATVDRTFGVDPTFHRGSGHGPIYMGEHPNVK